MAQCFRKQHRQRDHPGRALEFGHFSRGIAANPEGIGITQPRVARNELPWEDNTGLRTTLKGLNQRTFEMNFVNFCNGMIWNLTIIVGLIQPFQG